MPIRDQLNQNKPMSLAFAGVAAALAAWVVYRTIRPSSAPLPPPPTGSGQQYFYDPTTDEPVAGNDPADARAPAAAVLGKPGEPPVLARVYACGSCENRADRKVAYIETYTKETYAAKLKGEGSLRPDIINNPGAYREATKEWESGHMIAVPSPNPQWVPIESEEGEAILNKSTTLCGDKPMVICTP